MSIWQVADRFGGRRAGIYGLLAYVVTQKTRELGIRIVLGAPRLRLLTMVLRQAGGTLVAGLTAGLLLAYATSRLVITLFYGVKPHDPWTMAVMTLTLLVGGSGAQVHPGASCSRRRSDGGPPQRVTDQRASGLSSPSA